jgi:hypothetical protein
MSFNLYVRPLPVNVPEPESFYDLKHLLAEAGFFPSSSLRSEPVQIDPKLYPSIKLVFQGAMAVMGKDDDRRTAIKEFEAIMDNNPQGIEMWIGDGDDY